MNSIDPRWKLLYTPPPEVNGQADPVRPPAHPPFAHVPTVDGFRSPYEPAAANLNRNIHFRSYYDVPVQLREAPQPPPDFVVSNLDSDGHKALAQEVAQRQFGVPILEAQRCRLRITGQREEQAKDLGPAIQLSEFTLYDPSNIPIDLSLSTINCPNGGYSPDYEVVQNLLDGRPDTKFQRKEFDTFPVDIEVDLGAPFLLGSYSWRTAPDTPGRDPVSWQFQVLIGSKWTTLDQVFSFDTPTQRMAMVGPFGVDAPINGNSYPSMPPPPPIPQPIIRQSPAPIPRGSPTEIATEALLTLLSSGNADHLEMRVNELLWKGADPNARDKKGRTAFVKACAMRDPKIIQSMVNSRADVNAQATSGESGLHRLALFSDLHCMEILLKARADPNVADGEGDTPLMLSAARADPSAVRLLLSYGANPTTRNSRGQTGIDMLDDEFNRQGVVRPSSHEVRALLSSGVGMSNATRFQIKISN